MGALDPAGPSHSCWPSRRSHKRGKWTAGGAASREGKIPSVPRSRGDASSRTMSGVQSRGQSALRDPPAVPARHSRERVGPAPRAHDAAQARFPKLKPW